MPSPEMVLLQQNKDAEVEGGMNFLNGAHARPKQPEVRANANLTSWWGQQIPFSEIVKSGALVKKSDGNYGEGGGFTMGKQETFSSYEYKGAYRLLLSSLG